MALIQKWPFFHLFVLGNTSQENVFYDIPERKNAFLGQKNKKFKKWKIDIFLKGLTHGFGPRMAICPTIFFRQDRPGKCLLRDCRTKKRLSRPKNMKFKKSKNWLFSRRFNPKLWSKNGHFSNFFLGNISQENGFYYILKRKNTFLGYKKKTLKKLKNWHFFEFLNFLFL